MAEFDSWPQCRVITPCDTIDLRSQAVARTQTFGTNGALQCALLIYCCGWHRRSDSEYSWCAFSSEIC